jgi:hypothetical protein
MDPQILLTTLQLLSAPKNVVSPSPPNNDEYRTSKMLIISFLNHALVMLPDYQTSAWVAQGTGRMTLRESQGQSCAEEGLGTFGPSGVSCMESRHARRRWHLVLKDTGAVTSLRAMAGHTALGY